MRKLQSQIFNKIKFLKNFQKPKCQNSLNVTTFAINRRGLYRSNLYFDSAKAENVGKYFCLFNDSIIYDDTNYEKLVEADKASVIYIYLHGESPVKCVKGVRFS